MRKFVITFLVLTFSVVIGLIAGNILKLKISADSPAKTAQANNISTTPIENKGFVWGAQGGAYVLNDLNDGYEQEHADLQVSKAKELGLNLIRANLEIRKQDTPYSITYVDQANDQFVNSITSNGFDILMVLDPQIPESIGKADYYQEGYKMASHAANRYKGKVRYYQLANEISGTIVKKEGTKGELIKGLNGIDYSKEVYDATLLWLKGMSKGIRENDPNAKIVVSGHWILYDLFPKLIADGADFDILGWSWYSSDGTDPTAREYNYGDHLNLAKELTAIKKDVWIVETNSTGGSKGKDMNEKQGKQAQDQFFKAFLPKVYESGYFKGLVVYTLFDNPIASLLGNEADSHFGLVGAELNSQQQVNPTGNKPAFSTLKNYISTHK